MLLVHMVRRQDPGSPYSSMSSTWALFTLMISTFPLPGSPPAWIGARSSQCRTISRYPHVSIRHIPALEATGSPVPCRMWPLRTRTIRLGRHKRSHVRVCFEFAHVGNGENRQRGFDRRGRFWRGRDGRSRLYKLGKGNFFQKNFPTPNFYTCSKRMGGYSSTDASPDPVLLHCL